MRFPVCVCVCLCVCVCVCVCVCETFTLHACNRTEFSKVPAYIKQYLFVPSSSSPCFLFTDATLDIQPIALKSYHNSACTYRQNCHILASLTQTKSKHKAAILISRSGAFCCNVLLKIEALYCHSCVGLV